MFPNQRAAWLAAESLLEAGFRTDQVRLVNAETRDRHQFIDAKTADARRAMLLGTLAGALGGSCAGGLLLPVFGPVSTALLGGLAGAFGGTLLGLAVGRSTKSQVQDEMEHQVDAGSVLVSVVSDGAHVASALELLAKAGSASVVSTATSFTASVLPTTPGA